jgi:hypothetical protein
MLSAPGFTQFKAIITNIDQCNSNITCLDAHIIPKEEYLVNKAPTSNNQETVPESHLIMQTLPGFD